MVVSGLPQNWFEESLFEIYTKSNEFLVDPYFAKNSRFEYLQCFSDMNNLICKPGTCMHGHNIWIVTNQGMSLKSGKVL